MRPAVSRLALLSSTAVVGSLSFLAAAPAQAQMYSTGPGTYLSLEGRYMWNAGDKTKNYAYAYAGGNGTFLFAPYDTARTAADHGWGGKAMLGYRFQGNWDVGVGVGGGWLKGKDSALGYNYSTVEKLQALPPGGLGDSIKSSMHYTTVDFEAGYNMPMGGGSNFRLYGGLRFAYIQQKSKGNIQNLLYNTAGGVYYDYSGHRKTTFMGVGPRLGANGSFGIGNSGFNIFGGVSGALLVGKYKDKRDISYLGTNNANFFQAYNDRNKTKIVPNVDGEIGIGYNFGSGSGSNLGLQIGYRGEAFLGAATKGYAITYDETHKTGDYLLHGPFVRLIATFGAPAAAPVAAPPPPPPPRTAKSFIVFFDFDRSNITAQAQTTINDAIAAAKAGNSTRITLTGHTDRSGSEQYNQALSVRRGEAVKAAMIRGGIPANAIVVIGRGESQPLVPTADGVREPQNRRVEIVL